MPPLSSSTLVDGEGEGEGEGEGTLRSESTQAISVAIVGREEAGIAIERWRSSGRTGQWARQTRIKARGKGKKKKKKKNREREIKKRKGK